MRERWDKERLLTKASKDRWENDYYLTLAEDYLQTALEVLLKCGKRIDLQSVAACLDLTTLINDVRVLNDPVLAQKVNALSHYERALLSGLQSHFNQLMNSELGEYLTYQEDAFDLKKVIDQNAVAYFALPALKYPSFAKTLCKLIINDIKTTIEPLKGEKPIFSIFDEFSVFAGEQVLILSIWGGAKGSMRCSGPKGWPT